MRPEPRRPERFPRLWSGGRGEANGRAAANHQRGDGEPGRIGAGGSRRRTGAATRSIRAGAARWADVGEPLLLLIFASPESISAFGDPLPSELTTFSVARSGQVIAREGRKRKLRSVHRGKGERNIVAVMAGKDGRERGRRREGNTPDIPEGEGAARTRCARRNASPRRAGVHSPQDYGTAANLSPWGGRGAIRSEGRGVVRPTLYLSVVRSDLPDAREGRKRNSRSGHRAHEEKEAASRRSGGDGFFTCVTVRIGGGRGWSIRAR